MTAVLLEWFFFSLQLNSFYPGSTTSSCARQAMDQTATDENDPERINGTDCGTLG